MNEKSINKVDTYVVLCKQVLEITSTSGSYSLGSSRMLMERGLA